MYFWNIQNLKKDLKKETVSEHEQFKYLFAETVLLSSILAVQTLITHNVWDRYSGILQILITIFGMLYIYQMNGGKKGKHILKKYVCLGWVTAIRWLAMFMVPAIILFLIAHQLLFGYTPETSTPYDVVIINALYIFYFLYFGKHIKDISSIT